MSGWGSCHHPSPASDDVWGKEEEGVKGGISRLLPSLQVKEQKKRMDGPVDREGRKDRGGGPKEEEEEVRSLHFPFLFPFFGGSEKGGFLVSK